jgi:hypothetical protein
LVDATGESDWCARIGEDVVAVDVNARRAAESVLLGGFVSVDNLVVDDEA